MTSTKRTKKRESSKFSYHTRKLLLPQQKTDLSKNEKNFKILTRIVPGIRWDKAGIQLEPTVFKLFIELLNWGEELKFVVAVLIFACVVVFLLDRVFEWWCWCGGCGDDDCWDGGVVFWKLAYSKVIIKQKLKKHENYPLQTRF